MVAVCEHRDPPLPRSWVDVDTRGSVATVAGYPTTNRIWYRSPATPLTADVQRMTADVAASFRELCQEGRVTCIVAVQHLDTAAASSPAFVPTFVSVFTWFAVGRYNSGADLLNTFQVVLASGARWVPPTSQARYTRRLCRDPTSDASGVSYVTFCFDNLLYDSGSGARHMHCLYCRSFQHAHCAPPCSKRWNSRQRRVQCGLRECVLLAPWGEHCK